MSALSFSLRRSIMLQALRECLPIVEHHYHTHPDPDGSLWSAVTFARDAIAMEDERELHANTLGALSAAADRSRPGDPQ